VAIKKEYIEAKEMPSKMAEFKIKRLNRPSSVAGGWVDLTKFGQCSGAIDLEWLAQFPCVAALDLASTSDLASFRITWRVEGHCYTIGFRWCPSEAIAYRTERGTVPYQAWVETGLIVETEGNTIDYEVIEKDVVDLYKKYNITSIAYDKWNATDLVGRLVSQGLPMIEFVQGTQSFHPAMQALEIAYMKGDLSHGGDLVLNWCASNLVARRDVNLNMAPDKKKSSDKIDDFVTLIMTLGLLGTAPVKRKSLYDEGTI
jgi:phage terminase large subunit-like protein